MNVMRYSRPAMLLHWAQAALVLYLLWLGLTMVDLPKGAERSAAYTVHKSFGLLVLLLSVLRLAWRHRRPPPALAVAASEIRLVKGVHLGLYAFLILAPLAGYLAVSFNAYPLRFFGFDVPKAGWPDEGLNGALRQAHVILVWLGMGLIAAHLAGVLRHLLQRDGTLSRMLPGPPAP